MDAVTLYTGHGELRAGLDSRMGLVFFYQNDRYKFVLVKQHKCLLSWTFLCFG
jgi:hypothetical protein